MKSLNSQNSNKIFIKADYILVFRKFMKKLSFLRLLSYFFISNNICEAQIIGIIKDQIAPIEYATVVAVSLQDSSKIFGALSGINGTFKIENIPQGSYKLKVSFFGYKSTSIPSVDVNKGQQVTDIGIVTLFDESKSLDEVVVQGEKKDLLIDIDKKVYQVDKNPIATGGSAADVLKQIPSVNVDMDGNIQVRGSDNLIVWINGRPSGITGGSRQAILDQIPASAIDRVEIITNPSARYDPDGKSGIINIILKKNSINGINGSILAGVGSRDKYSVAPKHDPYNSIDQRNALNKYNGALSLNFKKGKFNLSTNMSTRENPTWTYGEVYRNNKVANNYFDQYAGGENLIARSYTLSQITDFSPTDKNIISLELLGGYSKNNQFENIFYHFKDSSLQPTYTNKRITNENRSNQNFDINLFWKKNFKQANRELNVSGTISWAQNEGVASFNQQNYLPRDFTKSISLFPENRTLNTRNGKNTIYILQTDYVHPFGAKTIIETGLKTTFRAFNSFLAYDTLNLSGNYDRNNQLSNNLIFNENVFAGYLICKYNFNNNWALQLGSRLEQTYVQTQTAEKSFNYPYLRAYPSFYVIRKIVNNQELKLNYSRRINRPGFGAINPIPTYTDPYNLMVGSQDIKPEDIHSFELGYSKTWAKHTFTPTLYYRRIIDPMTRYRIILLESGVSIQTTTNLSYAENFGTELILRNEWFKWWNLTSTVNFLSSKIVGSAGGENLFNENINYNVKVLSNFKFWKNADLQISANYASKVITPQGTLKAFNGVDIGFKKDIVKNVLALTININDIFNTRQFNIVFDTPTYATEFVRKWESRILTLNLKYKFGSQFGETKRGKKAEMNTEGGG